MTTLTITPKVADKTARFKGAVAAGEHVAVTIKGGAEWLGDDDGANLTLRVLDLVTGRTLAVFPRPQETMEEDETPDAWSEATEDANDLYCELNLNTTRMVAAARHMLRVPVLFVMGDTDDPRTLYFRDRHEIEYWPERIGDTTPYDLDRWPKQIDEWTELVAEWTSRMNNLSLDAERVDGGVKIMLNDGTLETPKEVVVKDGEVSRNEMNTAIAAMGATKQNTLTFDAIPTEGSDNPVKSGGVYGAVKEVADAMVEHVDDTGIHVTAEQKTAWTAKYAKPQGGIPKADLAAAVQTSLGKADTAIQSHQSLDAYVNAAGYDSDAKEIQLKHDSTVVARIDATAFIKDGMVDSVKISGGNLVISFNTDAGVEDIEIPLTDIFNPANYYDKTAADGRFVQKEAGKGLFSGSYDDLTDKPTIPAAVSVDATLTQPGAAADAKVTGDALAQKRGLGDLAVYAPSTFGEWTWTVSPALPDGAVIQQPFWGPETYPDIDMYSDGWWVFVDYPDGGGPQFLSEDHHAVGATMTNVFGPDGITYTVNFTRPVTGWTPVSPADALAKVSQLPTVPSAYASTPAMDGVGSAGSSTAWARGNHVHPSDTSRAAKTELPYPFVPATVTQEGSRLPASAFPIAGSYDGTAFSLAESDITIAENESTDDWMVLAYSGSLTICVYTSAGVYSAAGTNITNLTFGGSSTPPNMEFPNVLIVTPRTEATYTADTTAAAFTVAVGTGVTGAARDCVLVVDCTAAGAVAPTVTWPSNFHPRTDAEEIAPVAAVRNVFYISEYATGEFVVGGWHEEAE